MSAILQAQGLSRSFAGFHAVQAVDLAVEEHSIHALIGPNGAGKTTCFNLLTRFLDPTAGRIVYAGRDITRDPAASVARRGLVRSFQISAVFPALGVLENVRLALQRGRGLSMDWWRSDRVLRRYDDAARALLDEVGLGGWADEPAQSLPYGRKRALELATTLALQPRVILLDEPMAGMGAEDIGQAAALIRRAAQGRTVLMVEHNLSVVADLCDRITVLARGQVLAEGGYAEVSADPRVVEAYLGRGTHA
ncbi:ABC transporter ATP-binding protein [Piscinibacter sakaiensis]|uniref:Branched-chain amino acid transport ATP-binding protein LivG n=1 Tax=Piscinibacter sakaiensis TaxID=1547922 RepID=A0A0K8P726_PISS1|nr:ABC transporter ATP-binding protein [Piscinibacter sakaiensis]GAP38020.1 branched-chain amino acid transport ATP-binding protein LivG [Piscinibacter sakaiensis]